MALNITTAVIGSGCNAATASPSLAQWDKGQILQISGVELPETYKVEFSNGDTLEAIPAIGTVEGVEIPDKLLYSSSPIRAYIVLSEAEGERNTEYWVTIYVKPREIPEDIEPTPAQQDVIDDLIAQLNTGVGKAEAAVDEAEAASQAVQDLGVRAETAASGAPAAVQKIVDAETGAVTLVFFLPQGEAGVSPVVTVTTITGGHRVTVTDADGAHSFDVMDGEDGRSVTGVTMGADYKLTFTFSDGTTWTTPASIRGETGATPRLTIGTVSTLDPGQSATAEITGTPEDPVLNFGIPKGQAGASDAGAVTYNPETAYNDGTVGKAVSDLSRQISELEDTVSTTQVINTASGAIASFDDGADGQPIRKLVAQIEPVQEGTGDPSPDNVRPISGWTGCTISHSGSDTTNPDTLAINWETEAGIVYGGVVTLNQDGSADVVSKYVEVNLSKIPWSVQKTAGAYTLFTYRDEAWTTSTGTGTRVYCEALKYYEYSDSYYNPSDASVYADSSLTIADSRRLYAWSTYSTASAYKSYLASLGSQKALIRRYILSYPSYHFDNIGQLKTFLGTNNIWSSAGDTEVTYPADTKLYIEQLTKPTEDDMTADHAISAGTFFMIGNSLYLATSQIAAGATITPGTNATKLSLADALNQLNT